MKNMISALIFTGLMLPSTALAEGITTSLGFGIGPTYGAGITFRGEKGDWGLQATALPYYTQESSFFAGGVTGFYTINKGKYGSLYTSLGMGAYRRSSKTYNTVFIETPDKCTDSNPNVDGKCGYWKPDAEGTKIVTGGFAVGPGVGMEFDFAENFTFSIELPLALIFDVNNSVSLKSVVPVPNSALLYKF
jgi:hypothetical protein